MINKFRGDIDLLKPGINFLEKETKIRVLGVIPYFKDIDIPEEDGIFYREDSKKIYPLKIGVIKLPHIANHTDFDIFKKEKVEFSYIDEPSKIAGLDILVIPGTKNTIGDLQFLRKREFDPAVRKHVKKGKILVGICGGLQMLGKTILDPLNIESRQNYINGFNFFGFDTVFEKWKITHQVEASFIKNGLRVTGYEIHHGKTIWNKNRKPMFLITKRQDNEVKVFDGAYTENFRIWGTHIHGIFDNYLFRKWFLDLAYKKLGLRRQGLSEDLDVDKEIDKLAKLVRKNLDIKYLYRILNKYV